ncbi:class I SAM-dependent rRNA methyltransferase [Bordetella genomosp. 13]|uniref:23S rRNA (Cytosine(1962)-C(5))-methyltransferase RlmI n=1 Tax=Bordetella genomosp. 13 TaxID=463040 RepID=A0A1W6ZCF0_9BORD|nr:class I SAM-dependent rRNA methyltransferase [Bordetella genomosp. 13]ARP95063.1 23S rRNA (cytosine(1962)-C(5))-methyltransferase RlmI [Bordetella genomosp. 13]
MGRLILKPGKERSLLHRHPWLFAGAVDRVEGRVSPGATVSLIGHDGRFLARAAYSPHSAIRARVWTFDEAEPVDHAFFKRRIQRALAYRAAQVCGTGAVRLVFGEADGLPGLVVDHYRSVDGGRQQLVCQFMAVGVEAWKGPIVDALVRETGCAHVYERSDVSIREKEGLEQTTGLLAGDEPPELLLVDEGGVRYQVDVRKGHKTGFYIDQRDSRALIARNSAGRDVLNCFCYTGGFSLAALKGEARSVLSIDSSGEALAHARANVLANGFDSQRAQWLDADAFRTLRSLHQDGQSFDLIVLDPPKLAPSQQHVDRAARAYKDINLSGLKLLRPGGLLATYSCSGAIGAPLFQKIVADAAADAGADVRILGRLGAGADHPMLAGFPEGEYLKGLWLQRI